MSGRAHQVYLSPDEIRRKVKWDKNLTFADMARAYDRGLEAVESKAIGLIFEDLCNLRIQLVNVLRNREAITGSELEYIARFSSGLLVQLQVFSRKEALHVVRAVYRLYHHGSVKAATRQDVLSALIFAVDSVIKAMQSGQPDDNILVLVQAIEKMIDRFCDV
jgi:hypothetical protein